MVIFALTLVRHGETGHNKDNVIQGQLDVPLSSVGLEQALRLGNHLQHQKYTHVYASDLTRAKLTAESILEKSQVCHVNIVEDKRLRERKFGVIEGKSFKYLKEVASKSNQSVVHITPLGAETVQQVSSRAISFFKELCHLMCSLDAQHSNHTEEHSSKQTSLQISNGTTCSSSLSSSNFRNKRKREDSSEGQSPSVINKSPPELLEGLTNLANLQSKVKSSNISPQLCPKNANLAVSSGGDSDFGCDHARGASLSLSPSLVVSSIAEGSDQLSRVAPTFSDEAIRSHLTPCKCETEDSDCPNVSLSPLVSHNSRPDRTESGGDQNDAVSSTEAAISNSSGGLLGESLLSERERRTSICSSNDENDSSPDLAGNILIVSHGGLLKEMVRYFVEELNCSLPGGKKQAMRISPNAGLSKFSISLNDDLDDRPKIICHQIHDKHHLHEIGARGFGNAETTAL